MVYEVSLFSRLTRHNLHLCVRVHDIGFSDARAGYPHFTGLARKELRKNRKEKDGDIRGGKKMKKLLFYEMVRRGRGAL